MVHRRQLGGGWEVGGRGSVTGWWGDTSTAGGAGEAGGDNVSFTMGGEEGRALALTLDRSRIRRSNIKHYKFY
jgi:hypothetical protein